jgi:transcription elongation factor Elf1
MAAFTQNMWRHKMKAKIDVYSGWFDSWTEVDVEVDSIDELVQAIEYVNSFESREAVSVTCDGLNVDGSARYVVNEYHENMK